MVIALTFTALVGGCVDRELRITSEPPGALVLVSDKEVGRTPVTFSFTWYGDYDIILRRDGYETLKTHAHINAPVYQIPPLDFFVDIAPWTIHDRRYVHFRMEKFVQPSDKELIERADAMKKRNLEPVLR